MSKPFKDRVWAYLDDIPYVKGEREGTKLIPDLKVGHCEDHSPWLEDKVEGGTENA